MAGLNVEFDEVRGRNIGRQPLPSIGEVLSEVRREESRRNVMLARRDLELLLKVQPWLPWVEAIIKLLRFSANQMKDHGFGVIFATNLATLVRTVGKSMGNLQIGKEKQVTNQAEPLFLLLIRLRPTPSPLSKWSIFLHC